MGQRSAPVPGAASVKIQPRPIAERLSNRILIAPTARRVGTSFAGFGSTDGGIIQRQRPESYAKRNSDGGPTPEGER